MLSPWTVKLLACTPTLPSLLNVIGGGSRISPLVPKSVDRRIPSKACTERVKTETPRHKENDLNLQKYVCVPVTRLNQDVKYVALVP
jgi:hypothetical protein